uniref:protochlorophyllide reductase n=1 Tax=Rhodosorus marinus TaxID=101924 RepID=A0A7S2ZAP6_9RHOD|mmetsp:Transcript_12542/g.50966  ORF Transcript_12542/g.50966 Transcript_12542/m.50966 type:complete len:279 (+) Transcript_12542:69-905(+)
MAFVSGSVSVSSKVGVRSICGERVSQARSVNYNGRVRMVAAPETSKQSDSPQVPNVRTKTVVITGASSGIGKHAAKELSRSGEWNVIMAVRNPEKAAKVAEEYDLDKGSYKIMDLELGSLESVRKFVKTLKDDRVTVDTLVCNAAIWHPKDTKPRYTEDGYEEAVAVNYFGHFLLVNLMIQNSTIRPNLQRGQNQSRVVFIGTETHNPDTLPGKIPPQADLGDMQGLEAGFKEPIGMISGGKFEPTKAYKDSKVSRARSKPVMGQGAEGHMLGSSLPA